MSWNKNNNKKHKLGVKKKKYWQLIKRKTLFVEKKNHKTGEEYKLEAIKSQKTNFQTRNIFFLNIERESSKNGDRKNFKKKITLRKDMEEKLKRNKKKVSV